MSIFDFLSRFTPQKPIDLNLKPVVLIVFDGWGIAPPSNGNAIATAKTPYMNSLLSNYPHGQLIASGESVGLPANEVGNSEVGHLTIGVGRAINQSLVRINTSISDNTFYGNEAFMAAVAHTKKYKSRLHVMGLVSEGNVHSSTAHLKALIEFAKQQQLTDIAFHLFTDGRDAPPNTGLSVIDEIDKLLATLYVGRIASVSGRYYAMDRDARWDRIQKAYEMLTSGKGLEFPSATQAVNTHYEQGKTDEFIEPSVIVVPGEKPLLISDDDAVIFFNFRVDRARQLTMSLTLPDFENLKGFEWGYEVDQGKVKKEQNTGKTFVREKKPANLFFVTMTEYQKKLPVSAIAFPPFLVEHSLAQIVSEHGFSQIHIAESEKERMVTYYFDGLQDTRFTGESVQIVPSPKVGTYDKMPEMNARGVAKEVVRALNTSKYKLIVLNFANPDMVGHTGNFAATVKAIEAVDHALSMVVDKALVVNGSVLITADHGNAEELLSFNATNYFFTTEKGSLETGHSNNPVPFVIINNQLAGKPIELPQGALSDVAPTALALMDLPKPDLMTGNSLLPKLNS